MPVQCRYGKPLYADKSERQPKVSQYQPFAQRGVVSGLTIHTLSLLRQDFLVLQPGYSLCLIAKLSTIH